MVSNAHHRSGSPADDDVLAALLHDVAARDVTAFTRLWQLLAAEIADSVRADTLNSPDFMIITAATFVEVWWLAPLHDTPDTDIRTWLHAIARTRAIEHNRGSEVAGVAFTGPMWTSAINTETIELEVGSLLAAGFNS